MDLSTKKIAVFVDYDNQQLDVFALIELLRERGRVVIRKAYADWVARKSYRKSVAQAGFELIDCPRVTATHKNAADIRLAVDCLSVSYETDDIQIYVLVTGDVDFVPLINKLRTQGREIVVVAANQSAADLLMQSCDEFIPSYRLDKVETVSTGQLTFEDSLELLKKAYERLKSRGDDKAGKDTKSLLKQSMLQLNTSFDENDYEDCTSFTSYLEKARMYVKMDSNFEDAKPTGRSQGQDTRENAGLQIPDTLLVKVYNDAVRRWGRPITVSRFEKALFSSHQGQTLKSQGLKNINPLLNEFKEKGLLTIDNLKIVIPPNIRFRLGLEHLKLLHKPEVRKIVISKIITLARNWDEDKSDLTLNELRKSIIGSGDHAIARSDFNGIINALKAGGAFVSPDNVPVGSWNIPLHLISDKLSDLEAIILNKSIYKLISLSDIAHEEDEMSALAELLLGKPDKRKIDEVQNIFLELEKDEQIRQKNSYWIKNRK